MTWVLGDDCFGHEIPKEFEDVSLKDVAATCPVRMLRVTVSLKKAARGSGRPSKEGNLWETITLHSQWMHAPLLSRLDWGGQSSGKFMLRSFLTRQFLKATAVS